MQSSIRNILVAAAAGAIVIGPLATVALGAPLNVRGTIQHVDGNTIQVKESSGGSVAVHLTNDAKVVSVARASLSDVKPGTFVGTAAIPQSDGTLQAIEVHIFPESMRGTGEGDRAWDIAPKSSMTNGTVAQEVNKVEGNNLTVRYRGGDKVVAVTPKTQVVALVPAGPSDLKPDEKIFIPAATRKDDGSLEASRVTVGKDGLAPPM
jgi:hypothetical protein